CAKQGRQLEAASLAGRALTVLENALGPGHPDWVDVLNTLILVYHDLRRAADADALLGRAVGAWKAVAPQQGPQVVERGLGLANLLRKLGRPAEVEPVLRQVVECVDRLPATGPSAFPPAGDT